MKLRNKKTGEIVEWYNNTGGVFPNSLAELNEEWEDYEEPKDFWFIDPETLIACESTEPLLCDKKVAIETMKQIGNYFETKEEAEKVVEKLKAWKRLKEDLISLSWQPERDGEFSIWGRVNSAGIIKADAILDNHRDDLDLLFGGEE